MAIRTDKTITGVSYNGTSIPLVGTPTLTKSTTITSNGSSVVVPDTGYTLSQVSINVNVPGPSGSINITSNGTHNVTNYASAVVNVPGSIYVPSYFDSNAYMYWGGSKDTTDNNYIVYRTQSGLPNYWMAYPSSMEAQSIDRYIYYLDENIAVNDDAISNLREHILTPNSGRVYSHCGFLCSTTRLQLDATTIKQYRWCSNFGSLTVYEDPDWSFKFRVAVVDANTFRITNILNATQASSFSSLTPVYFIGIGLYTSSTALQYLIPNISSINK